LAIRQIFQLGSAAGIYLYLQNDLFGVREGWTLPEGIIQGVADKDLAPGEVRDGLEINFQEGQLAGEEERKKLIR
jgi:hypothetical protein